MKKSPHPALLLFIACGPSDLPAQEALPLRLQYANESRNYNVVNGQPDHLPSSPGKRKDNILMRMFTFGIASGVSVEHPTNLLELNFKTDPLPFDEPVVRYGKLKINKATDNLANPLHLLNSPIRISMFNGPEIGPRERKDFRPTIELLLLFQPPVRQASAIHLEGELTCETARFATAQIEKIGTQLEQEITLPVAGLRLKARVLPKNHAEGSIWPVLRVDALGSNRERFFAVQMLSADGKPFGNFGGQDRAKSGKGGGWAASPSLKHPNVPPDLMLKITYLTNETPHILKFIAKGVALP